MREQDTEAWSSPSPTISDGDWDWDSGPREPAKVVPGPPSRLQPEDPWSETVRFSEWTARTRSADRVPQWQRRALTSDRTSSVPLTLVSHVWDG